MAKFVVDLGDLPMSDEEKSGIASAIHAAVIGHLATTSNAGLHAATKTLNHAGMLAAPAAAGKTAIGKAAMTKAATTKATTAKAAATAKTTIARPAAATRAPRKQG